MDRDAIIYVIEDDAFTVDLIESALRDDGYVVRHFTSGEAFLAHRIDKLEVGCVITDLCLPGIQGTQVQDELLRTGSQFPVIVVSGISDVSTAVRIMRRGAVTMLEKPFSVEQLLDSVHEGVAESQRRQSNLSHLNDLQSRLSLLTANELEVLKYLVKGWTRKAISATVDISPRTVDRRRKSVLEKMQVQNLEELIARLAIQPDGTQLIS